VLGEVRDLLKGLVIDRRDDRFIGKGDFGDGGLGRAGLQTHVGESFDLLGREASAVS
jgi:hypothetical protein